MTAVTPPFPDGITATPFEYFAADGITKATSTSKAQNISDYVYKVDLDGKRRKGNSPKTNSLGKNIGEWKCILCKQQGNRCLREECVDAFQANSANVWESLVLKQEPSGPALGFGVHVKQRAKIIPAGSILGEYLGEVSLVEGDRSVPAIINID